MENETLNNQAPSKTHIKNLGGLNLFLFLIIGYIALWAAAEGDTYLPLIFPLLFFLGFLASAVVTRTVKGERVQRFFLNAPLIILIIAIIVIVSFQEIKENGVPRFPSLFSSSGVRTSQ